MERSEKGIFTFLAPRNRTEIFSNKVERNVTGTKKIISLRSETNNRNEITELKLWKTIFKKITLVSDPKIFWFWRNIFLVIVGFKHEVTNFYIVRINRLNRNGKNLRI